MDRKFQGNVGEVEAVRHYVRKGFRVSKPLFENSPYDLIVDDGTKLFRVQVKTSQRKTSSGKFEVNLCTKGGNRSGTGKTKKLSSEEVDLLFVHLADDRIFELPISQVENRATIAL